MTIVDELIDPNPYSRPGFQLRGVWALIVHWTAAPGQTSKDVRVYYQGRARGNDGYGSAHVGIDPDGSIHRWVPETEVAYAVGASGHIDPTSGKLFTDQAREIFKAYATPNTSPNFVTLSAEWMTSDALGTFTSAEYDAAIQLYAAWAKKYQLDPMTRILTHKQVVGWKDCHKWFVDHPADLDAFRQKVKEAM